jgi:hypothetical protein
MGNLIVNPTCSRPVDIFDKMFEYQFPWSAYKCDLKEIFSYLHWDCLSDICSYNYDWNEWSKKEKSAYIS